VSRLGGVESLLEAVNLKKATEGMGKGRVANVRWERVPHNGAATLKPREAKVVRTRGTDSRLMFAERRERVGRSCGNSEGSEGKRAEWSRVLWVKKRGKLEVYTLFHRKPMKTFKNTR